MSSTDSLWFLYDQVELQTAQPFSSHSCFFWGDYAGKSFSSSAPICWRSIRILQPCPFLTHTQFQTHYSFFLHYVHEGRHWWIYSYECTYIYCIKALSKHEGFWYNSKRGQDVEGVWGVHVSSSIILLIDLGNLGWWVYALSCNCKFFSLFPILRL